MVNQSQTIEYELSFKDFTATDGEHSLPPGSEENNNNEHEFTREAENTDNLHSNQSDQKDSDVSSEVSFFDENEVRLNGRGTRKRKTNFLNWKQNRRKFKRNAGLEYITKKGKIVPKKNCLGTINKCCVLECHKKFTLEELLKINTRYWSLENYTRKRDFIEAYVKESLCARVKQGGGSHRKFTYHYHLPKNLHEESKVCKTLFLNVLNISATTVQTLKVKKRANLDVGADLRGKTSSNNVPENLRQTVHTHIKSFPVLESHYCRKDSNKLYLESTLNQSKMYEMYKDFMSENYPDLTAVKESFYKHIFCTEYNMSFHNPKKDTCKYCEKYTMNPSEDNLPEYTEHIKRKDLARKEKTEDKAKAYENPTFKCFTFDLQSVLYSPCSNVSSFFYTRKFCTYNLTLFDQTTREGHCFIWNETNGGRGSDEVGTILFNFLKNLDPSIKTVVLFSDSCGGQNRNRYIATILKYAVWVLPNLERIEIKFLEVGHTQMEVDSMHSVIERNKKNKTIYSPLEWPAIVRSAKRTNPYEVTVMEYDQFYDLKRLNKDLIKGKYFTHFYYIFQLG